jgi:hypothetical protein
MDTAFEATRKLAFSSPTSMNLRFDHNFVSL